jgi:hypothetical protein
MERATVSSITRQKFKKQTQHFTRLQSTSIANILKPKKVEIWLWARHG